MDSQSHQVVFPIANQELILDNDINQQLKWLMWSWHSKEMTNVIDGRQWWEFWKIDAKHKTDLLVIGRYLLEALDDFVRIAILNADNSPWEYKSTILDALSTLYDVVMKEAETPWWLMPFGGSLKNLIIEVLASLLIDFLITSKLSQLSQYKSRS